MLALGYMVLAAASALSLSRAANTTKPNFVFIITDDQDLLLDSLSYQSAIREHFVDQGTTFSKLTLADFGGEGRAAHNTNVTDVSPPYGGYTKFISEGWNENYLPVWLQQAGYNTYYTGKLMNGHSTNTYNSPFASGWTANDFFLDPNTYIYYNVTMQRDHEVPVNYPGQYSTDLVANRSVAYLDSAIADGKPFFLGVAPIGPHSLTIGGVFTAPVPADRHKDLFPGIQVPRTASFNPDVATGASWRKTLAQANQTVVDYFDDFYRKRIQALQSVDEMIDSIMARLAKDPEVLENTYFIYTSDNGFHIGQHRLAPGKTCAIEEDINVPFLIRGPGIEKGQTVSIPSTHTDIVPTIFQLAGIPLQDDFDGEPIPVTSAQRDALTHRSEHVNVEFWGYGILEGDYPGVGSGLSGNRGLNNTYKAVRIIGDSYDIAYTVWCTNEHELYDMTMDSVQMNNLYGTSGLLYSWDLDQLTARIDALLLTLKGCKGKVCTRPWETLHPEGNVLSLADAMNSEFDDFYVKEQEKVSFSACQLGYLAEYEGALQPLSFSASGATHDARHMQLRDARWEDWV